LFVFLFWTRSHGFFFTVFPQNFRICLAPPFSLPCLCQTVLPTHHSSIINFGSIDKVPVRHLHSLSLCVSCRGISGGRGSDWLSYFFFVRSFDISGLEALFFFVTGVSRSFLGNVGSSFFFSHSTCFGGTPGFSGPRTSFPPFNLQRRHPGHRGLASFLPQVPRGSGNRPEGCC